MSEEQDPEKYYDPLGPSKESQRESEDSSLKSDAQNYALKKGREALSKTTKPVAGGTGSAVAGGGKAAVSGGATSAAGSMAGDGAANLVGSSAGAASGAASGAAAGSAVSGAGIAGAAVGEVSNLKESINEGDGTGVVDSGVRVAAIAAGTYFGGSAGGAAASAALNTEVGRQTSRGVSKIIVAVVSFAVLSLLLFMGMSVTIAAAVTQQQRNSNQIQTCRDMAAGIGGPTAVSPQSPTVINTGPNITVIGEDGTADVSEDVSTDVSGTVGTCFTSTFSGEATVPIGGTLQPDGTYARIPGSAISDTYMGHKGRYNGSPGALDIAAPMNTPILAATDGVVLSVTSRELGNGITVQVSPNVKMLYWHAETVFVKPGDKIQTGQQIALVGTTGYSTGPHLHLGVYVDGVDVDPQTFFLPKGINFYEIFGME